MSFARSGQRRLFIGAFLAALPLSMSYASAFEIVAHRGNNVVAPENTLASIRAAAGVANFTEWDIQTTYDGEFVVMHDLTVNRTTNGSGNVADLTLTTIKSLDAGYKFSSDFIGERVPTNKESVQLALSLGIHPLIERKTGSAQAVYNELVSLNVVDKVSVMGFDLSFVSAMRALNPTITLGTLGSGTLDQAAVDAQKATGANYVGWDGVNILDKATVDRVHAAGLELYVYTVDNPDSIDKFNAWGADKVISDDPGILTRPLEQIAAASGIVRIDKNTTASRTGNTRLATITRQSPGFNLLLPDDNNGDIDLGFNARPGKLKGFGIQQSGGILMANINEIGQRGVVEVAGALSEPVSFLNGNLSNTGVFLSTSAQVGGGEANYDISAGYFPYANGWVGSLVLGDGQLSRGGNLPVNTVVTNGGVGRYSLTMPGISSTNDGMLFVIGAKNNDANLVGASPRADGTGWNVAVRNFNGDLTNGESDPWQFVYVPFDAKNLIGARVNADGSTARGVGAFQITNPSAGTYLIKIGNFTDSDGALLLSIAGDEANSGGIVDDNFLGWAYSAALGGFVVESRDLPNGELANGAFSFAFMQFNAPLAVPEPATMAMALSLGTMTLRRCRRR